MLQNDIVISASNIIKSYNDQTILNDISFEVSKGEIFGFLGLNGAGKTSLIKIILDLAPYQGGEIQIFGSSSKQLLSREKLVYLPEKFYPSLLIKGREFLEFAVGLYGLSYDPQAALEYSKVLDFPIEALNKPISQYSKGMGQKLGLISVFLSRRELMILDEPMSGLDPKARIGLKALIKEYVQQGGTIFFTSHILSDVEELCDHVAVLDNGKIKFLGSPAVLKDEKGGSTKSFEKAFLDLIGSEKVEMEEK